MSKAKVLELAEIHGIQVDGLYDCWSLTLPDGKVFEATNSHSMTFNTSFGSGGIWNAMLKDIKSGIVDCNEDTCDDFEDHGSSD